MCVYGYSSVITLEVQNTWRKGLSQGFVGSDKSSYLQFQLPKRLLRNTAQFFSNKIIISDGTLWGQLPILLPSGLGRSQGEECNHTSAICCGIPGFDSSSVESCQPDSCPDVGV